MSHIVLLSSHRDKPRWYVNLTDFANMVKAFLGANYLSVPYGFSQSGLALGIPVMLLIACLTDHCCHLIVKTKHHIIEKYTKTMKNRERQRSGKYTTESSTSQCIRYRTENEASKVEASALEQSETAGDSIEQVVNDSDYAKEYMMKHMAYGDVAKHCYGNAGVGVVNLFIALTQFGFCVGNFIFIGNTLHSIFPVQYCYHHLQSHEWTCDTGTSKYTGINDTAVYRHSLETVGSAVTVIPNTSFDNTTYIPINASAETWAFIKQKETTAPDLMILVATPLPVFIVFALIRNVRYIGLVSAIATISIFVGIVSAFGYLVNGFTVSDTFVWTNWQDIFVFFGLVTGSFEGIGLVVPVESSMEGNRHLFPCFLHGAIFVLTSAMGTFGILGYLRFGKAIEQLLNQNIPPGEALSVVINVSICVGILLTFPLQIFPAIEILEKYLFTPGKLCGPVYRKHEGSSDKQALLETGEDHRLGTHPDITNIPDSVPAWKRNVVRVLTVLSACGLAVLMRDYFAYGIALIGALGSSALAYILPCLFHLKICWNDIGTFIKAKDIVIIILGVIASIICVAVVIEEFVSGNK